MAYDGYWDKGFIFAFLLSSLMGFLLNYSSMLCTNYNSPLTTAVVGACKVCSQKNSLRFFMYFPRRIYSLLMLECLSAEIICIH